MVSRLPPVELRLARTFVDPHTDQRLHVEGLPVKAWGMAADGRPFVLNAVVHEVSYHGARLDGLTCKVAAGEIIAVQYGGHKGRFRVVWVGDAASDHPGQVGIRALDDSCIWETELANVAPPAKGENQDPLAAARRDRRQYARLRCPGNVQLSRTESGQHVWAKLGDVSMGGCYIDTPVPEQVGTKLWLVLHVGENKISATGEVRSCVPALGMGIQFTGFKSGSRELLKQIVDGLSAPKLTGRPASAASEQAGNIQELLTTVRDYFEGNNILTSQEFEAIVQAWMKKNAVSSSAAAGAKSG